MHVPFSYILMLAECSILALFIMDIHLVVMVTVVLGHFVYIASSVHQQ